MRQNRIQQATNNRHGNMSTKREHNRSTCKRYNKNFKYNNI